VGHAEAGRPSPVAAEAQADLRALHAVDAPPRRAVYGEPRRTVRVRGDPSEAVPAVAHGAVRQHVTAFQKALSRVELERALAAVAGPFFSPPRADEREYHLSTGREFPGVEGGRS